MAQLLSLRTKGSARRRFLWKWRLLRLLYDRRYDRETIIDLFRFIDGVLALPLDLEEIVRDRLHRHEEERRMPYVTSFERLAREEGRDLGRKEGRDEGSIEAARNAICQVLESRFGPVPEDLDSRIHSVAEPAALEELIRRAAVAESLEAFTAAFGDR